MTSVYIPKQKCIKSKRKETKSSIDNFYVYFSKHMYQTHKGKYQELNRGLLCIFLNRCVSKAKGKMSGAQQRTSVYIPYHSVEDFCVQSSLVVYENCKETYQQPNKRLQCIFLNTPQMTSVCIPGDIYQKHKERNQKLNTRLLCIFLNTQQKTYVVFLNRYVLKTKGKEPGAHQRTCPHGLRVVTQN